MNRMLILTVLATAAVVLAASPWGFAATITLISSSGGVYDYGVTLGADENVFFSPNQTITLSGLSDVTGASIPPADFFGTCFIVGAINPSSVVYAQTLVENCGIMGVGVPRTVGTLVVDSSVLTLRDR